MGAESDGSGSSPNRGLRRVLSAVLDGKKMASSQRDVKAVLKKPRSLIALGMFGLTLARAAWNYSRDRRLSEELMATFDLSRDHRLTTNELTSLLGANGMDVSSDQVKKLFGRVDDEGDGFDTEELVRVLNVVSLLPAASQRIQQIAGAGQSLMFDVCVCAACGLGLMYLVGHSDAIERKSAANSFHSAVSVWRMRAKCGKLDARLSALSDERGRLEREIKELEATSCVDAQQRSEELERLDHKLREVQSKQHVARKQLEDEVVRWQAEADRCTREATMTRLKMERMMHCIKGLEAFSGTGTGSFADHGAQQGFSVGFARDTITFGTIEDGKLLMYETSHARKLGDGRDSAFRCHDLETGREFALKMYTIQNPEQRRAIHHDLYAHKSQVGKHPHIVSYERVIESENMIFVMMELLHGKDLFDVVVSRELTESQARRLFVQLTEALQHLHHHQVIHCDVKPENAMVLGDINAGTAHLKLIDFGCSCFSSYDQDSQGCVVYDTYTPPELGTSSSKPTVATDMWRLGCTLYIMLVRCPPFYDNVTTRAGRELREASGFFRTPEYDALSPEAQDLIKNLIVGDPSKRLTTEAVLKHPWVLGR